MPAKSQLFKLAVFILAFNHVYSSYSVLKVSFISSILTLNAISSNGNYISKSRFVRFENRDNCGKRKRNIENRKCFRLCTSDADCRGSKRRCLCDGECGMSCVRITTSCTKIDEFKNGVVTYVPDNLFGSNLVYECDASYTLIGNKVRTCEGDGWWSGTSPVCVKEMFCEYPPMITNAIPNVQISNETSYKTGTEVEYQCDVGYTYASAKMNNKIYCQDNGKWSDINLKCTKIECGKPEEIENGILRATDYSYSSVIEYKCNAGYRIRNGDYLRECDLNGKWTGRKPSCEPVNCGEPPFVKNTLAIYNQTVFKSITSFKCMNDDYYITDESAKLTCQQNGKWSDNLPRCLEKNCSLDAKEYSKDIYTLISTTNQISEGSYAFPIRTTIKILCHNDYELVGDTENELTCNLDNLSGSRWSNIPPICKLKVYCSLPPGNGLLIYTSSTKPTKYGYSVNTTLEYKCVTGYKLIGSGTQQCSSNGEWIDPEQPLCLVDDLTSTQSARIDQLNCRIDSSSMLFSYNELSNTILHNEFLFLNATPGSYIEHGKTVSYFCKESDIEHIYYAKCLNGTLVTQQNCNEIITKSVNNTIGKACPPPVKIPNGFNKFSSFLHGSKVIYQCLTGFELSKGDKELKCTDGSWVGVLPTCSKINCGFPGHIPNGRILYIGTLAEYTYQPYMTTVGQNKQIRYECDKDYKLVGPSGSTCINGNWKPSVKLVQCVKDQSKAVNVVENDVYSIPLRLKSKHTYFNSKQPNSDEVTFVEDDLFENLNKNNIDNKKLKRLKKHKIKRTQNETKQLKSEKAYKRKKNNHYSENKMKLRRLENSI